MSMTLFLLSCTPVLLLSLLAIGLRRSALELAAYGFAYVALLTVWAFQTPWQVVALATVDGFLTTLPLLAVVFLGILFSQLLVLTGSLARLVGWLLSGLSRPLARQVLVTLGLGNFFEGASIIAEPMVAPMLTLTGVPPKGAAALSIIGYAGLMGIEMAGIIITVLALVTGLPYDALGVATAWLSVPATVLMAGCLPWFLPEPGLAWRRLPYLMGCALLVSLTALAAALWLGIAISGMVGGMVLVAVLLWRGDRWPVLDARLGRDLAPFAVILLPLLLVNTIPGLRELTTRQLTFSLRVIPTHTVTFTPLFSAYLYLLLALLAAVSLLKVSRERWRQIWQAGVSKGWRALLAMGLFGAMGQIIAYSGSPPDFGPVQAQLNIPVILAAGLKDLTGSLYPVFVPLLGWAGTFLTGYGVASLMLFGDLQVQAAALLGVSPIVLAAALTVGSAIGSISSPFKIAIATPMCGAEGQEGAILRLTIPLGILASLLLGLIVWLLPG